MLQNSLPLPVELLDEILGECNPRDLWNFAKTSRASYFISFRILASKYSFPLSLPHAIHSGFLEQHKVDRVWNLIDSISIDVSKDLWQIHPEGPTIDELTLFLKSKQNSNKAVSIKIYTSENQDCSIATFVKIYRLVFSLTPDNIKSLKICISVDQQDERNFKLEIQSLSRRMADLLYKRPHLDSFTALPVKSVDVEILGFNARTLTQLVIVLVSNTIIVLREDRRNNTQLESLGIKTIWKHGSYHFSENKPGGKVLFSRYFPASQLKRLRFEDKFWSSIYRVIQDVVIDYDGLEELHIDCGMGQSLAYYWMLHKLKQLQILSLNFPYQSGMTGSHNCLRCDFTEFVQTETHFLQLITNGLRQIHVQFVWSDANVTNTTRYQFNRSDVMFTGSFRPTIEDLGDRPTDITDRNALQDVMLQEVMAIGHKRPIFMARSVMYRYMEVYARELIEQGDDLQSWDPSHFDGVNANRRDIPCKRCNIVEYQG
ncbi:hypothetical protein TWF694_005590 [Orbilia ellipsospora]|uniref:F-box domain-containing protein n=1 Tax=Orbilia ellipsospora TaxID=2528407 RepID=A0AAV9WVM4_9PEZI